MATDLWDLEPVRVPADLPKHDAAQAAELLNLAVAFGPAARAARSGIVEQVPTFTVCDFLARHKGGARR
jgi:hypothetical protein